MRNPKTASSEKLIASTLLILAFGLCAGCSENDPAPPAALTRPFLYKDQEDRTTAAEFAKADLQPVQVSELAENQNLSSITFYECTGLNEAFLEELSKLEQLTELHLIRCQIANDSFNKLARLPQLTSLTLSHLEIGEEQLASLEHCVRLRSLNLTGKIAETALPGLSAVPQLEHLEIAIEGFQPGSISELALPELRTLSLPNNELSDDDLIDMPVRTNLRQLKFPAGKVSDTGLAALARFPSLVRLDLSGSQVTSKGLPAVTGLEQLEELTLYNCKLVTNESLPILAGLQKLKRLQLEKSGVGGADLQRLGSSESLVYIGIGETQVTPAEAKALSELLPGCEVDRIRELP